MVTRFWVLHTKNRSSQSLLILLYMFYMHINLQTPIAVLKYMNGQLAITAIQFQQIQPALSPSSSTHTFSREIESHHTLIKRYAYYPRYEAFINRGRLHLCICGSCFDMIRLQNPHPCLHRHRKQIMTII